MKNVWKTQFNRTSLGLQKSDCSVAMLCFLISHMHLSKPLHFRMCLQNEELEHRKLLMLKQVQGHQIIEVSLLLPYINSWTSEEYQGKNGNELLLTVDDQLLKKIFRTSLAVQWLRIHFAMQGIRVQSLVEELRSHMLQSN